MLRSYEFYKKNFNMEIYEVNKIKEILENIEKGNIVEKDIRSLGENGLKFCLAEGKYELFKRLVAPFAYGDGSEKNYKYLLDPISLGVVDFIKNCPGSIMEKWVQMNKHEKLVADLEEREYIPVSEVAAAEAAIVLYPELKDELLNAIYSIELDKIMNVKIKDVLAKQISGMGHTIQNVRDVIHYSELPVLCSALDLFSKNIITTANDTEGCFNDGEIKDDNLVTNLIIDYASLDEANKLVADTLVTNGNARYQEKSYVGRGKGLILEVPCKRDDFVYSVNEKMMKLVSQFHKQDMIYGKLTIEDIYELISLYWNYLSEDERIKVNAILEKGYASENILEVLKYFPDIFLSYDEDENIFWNSEYYYKKHREYLKEQLEVGMKV